MSRTGIEWTDATWNPISGCTKVSAGCANCYAERWAKRTFKGRPPARSFSEVLCHPERLRQPLHWRKPRRIFLCSMGDLFHEAVPFHFVDGIVDVIQRTDHIYQILTKRPARVLEYFKSTGNRIEEWAKCGCCLWLGVSVEDQATADKRIPILLQTPAAVRFVSIEPMLGEVRLDQIMVPEGLPPEHERRDGPWTLSWNALTGERSTSPYSSYKYPERIDWVIVGGESGPKARPMHADWVRSVRNQCRAAGVPFFFKQWGEWVPVENQGYARRGYATDFSPPLTKWVCKRCGHTCDDIGGCNDHLFAGGTFMRRVGKKRAGRLLDGRTWDEMPDATEFRK